MLIENYCLQLNESCNDDLLDLTSLYAETVDQLTKVEISTLRAEMQLSESYDNSYVLQEMVEEAIEKGKKIKADIVAKFYEIVEKVQVKWEHLQTTIQSKFLNSGKAQHIFDAAKKSQKLRGKKWATTAKVGYLEPKLINPVLKQIPVDFQRVAAKDLQGDADQELNKLMTDLSKLVQESQTYMEEHLHIKNIMSMSNIINFAVYSQKADAETATNNQAKMDRINVYYAGMEDLNRALQFLKMRQSAVKSMNNIKHTVNSFKGRADKVNVKAYQHVVLKIVKVINKATKASLRLFKEVRKFLSSTSINKEEKHKRLVDKTSADRVNEKRRKESEEAHARGIHDESVNILSQYGYLGNY